MSILVYTGVPGSGKSVHAAREIRYNLNSLRPRPVIANFELAEHAPVRRPDMFHYVPNASLSVDDLTAFAVGWWEANGGRLCEDGIDVYFDEAQLLWNARLWSQSDRLKWLEFLSQSRKYGYRVVMIAQSAKMLDNQFRMLVETEVNHRRMSAMGLAGYLMALPFRNRLIVAVRSAYQINERTGSQWLLVNRRDWAMYDSYKKFDPNEQEKDRRLLKVVNE